MPSSLALEVTKLNPRAAVVLRLFDLQLAERVRHVLQSTFNGRRIVIFSGGARTEDATILDEVRAIRAGGGFGSIIGRNSFQRDRQAALDLLDHMIRIYKGETPKRRRN